MLSSSPAPDSLPLIVRAEVSPLLLPQGHPRPHADCCTTTLLMPLPSGPSATVRNSGFFRMPSRKPDVCTNSHLTYRPLHSTALRTSCSFRLQGAWGRGAAAGMETRTQAHQVNVLPLIYTRSLSFNLLNTPGLLITKLTCPRKWGTCPEPQSVGNQLELWVLTPKLHFLHKQRVTCPSESLERDTSSAFACVTPAGP